MSLKVVESSLIKKKFNIYTHPSGLKVLLYPMKDFSSNYVLFGTKYGSVDTAFKDDNGNLVELPEGIAHFLEHKLFESEDGDAFAKYAKTGAYSNAYTSFDRTCYLFSCSNRFYDNLSILLDFVRSPYFTAATVEKEQGIIGQEIRMYDDMPSWRVMFNMLEAMFYSHPVRIDIAGTAQSIAKISDKLLYDCYNRYYNLSNMFLILAGDFNCDEVVDFVKDNLKPCDNPPKDIKTVIPDEPKTPLKNKVVCNLDVAKPLFCIGFKEKNIGATPDAKRLVAMEILLKMIAGTATPLYKHLLDEGLINEEFSLEYFTGRGFALPMFEGESDQPEKVLELILNQVEQYKQNGLDKTLFEATKREMYGKGIRRFDAAESVCSMLCDSYVLGYDLFEYFDILAEIKPEDILDELNVFSKESAVLSIVNPRTVQGVEN